MNNEKSKQLGMNPSTAAHRLKVDILFSFAVKLGYKCFHCHKDLDRDSFSIEHKTAWLHSKDPASSFFDLGNIAFSHLGCNSANKRHPQKKYFTLEERRAGNAARSREWKRANYSAADRSIKYARSGK